MKEREEAKMKNEKVKKQRCRRADRQKIHKAENMLGKVQLSPAIPECLGASKFHLFLADFCYCHYMK